MIVGLITGSPFSADVASFRDKVKSCELCWLIDRHSSLFCFSQNIHKVSIFFYEVIVKEK